jgi:hypothetical protein
MVPAAPWAVYGDMLRVMVRLDLLRDAGLLAVVASGAACARPIARAPTGTAVDACRAAVAAAIADDARTRTEPDPHPTYLLDFRHVAGCAAEVEHVAADLADDGHDTFPWDPSFDRPLCVRTGRVCFQRPVRRAVHLTLDDRQWSREDDLTKDSDLKRLPVPVASSACASSAPDRAAFSVFLDAAGQFGPTGYRVRMTCDDGKWTARFWRFFIVY